MRPMTPQDSQEEQADKGFTISDKRLFTKEGARRPSPSATAAPPASTPPPRPEAAPPEAARPGAPRPPRAETAETPRYELPPADFATFVAMLANNIMLFLGQIPDPVSQQRRRDLPQAKHTIDILV